MPESVRWLLVKGRREEAEAIIKKSAKVNKVDLLESDLAYLEIGTTCPKNPGKKKSYSFLDILKRWTFAKVALNVWFNW